MPPLAMVLLAVLCIATGQLLFKLTADRIKGQAIMSILEDWSTLLIFGTALGIYAGATVLWVLALRDLSLAYAYMFMALSFVLVPVAAMALFGERVTPSYFVGAALIICGLMVVVWGRQ
jgi:drug/metabolite transporter (DMT)-like permease